MSSLQPTQPDESRPRPAADLIAQILGHHRVLRSELPRLRAMAVRVLHAHGRRDPERLRALALALEAFEDDFEHHLRMEERQIFPLILKGEDIEPRIEGALHDHGSYLWFIDTVRELTDDFAAPDGACATWRGLWKGLRDLSRSLAEHIALENELFFPRRS